MEKIVYYDVYEKVFMNEIDVRKMFFDYEISDILNNIEDFKKGVYDLEKRLNEFKISVFTDIDTIILLLYQDYGIEIKKYKEID